MSNELAQVKKYLSDESIKKRLDEVLGNESNAFAASLVNAVSSNALLQKCTPQSIMGAAFTAAALKLPIDPNLGFSAIIPYKDKAQFQIMYKGFLQLAIRTGLYENINANTVYQDEIKSYNPITGEVEFVESFKECTDRKNNANIAGYYAFLKLKNGFKHEVFMTPEEVQAHALKYSQKYNYDLRNNKATSKWITDFDAMAKKTVLKSLISKWGIMSVSMQQALEFDQKVFADENTSNYEDNPNFKDTTVIDAMSEIIEVESEEE